MQASSDSLPHLTLPEAFGQVEHIVLLIDDSCIGLLASRQLQITFPHVAETIVRWETQEGRYLMLLCSGRIPETLVITPPDTKVLLGSSIPRVANLTAKLGGLCGWLTAIDPADSGRILGEMDRQIPDRQSNLFAFVFDDGLGRTVVDPREYDESTLQ
jgi:hypothetical protein